MTKIIKNIFIFFRGEKRKTPNDFSDFFDKPSRQKVKVIRRVLREANAEQRKIVREYHESLGMK